MLSARGRMTAWQAVSAIGGAMIVLAIVLARLGRWELFQLLLFSGALTAIIGLIFLFHANRDARSEKRLREGKDVIARWRVAPGEWEKFAAFDAVRGNSFASEAWLPAETPADGVEVIVGKHHILLGRSLLAFHDQLVSISLLCHIELPADPPCIELAIRSIDKHQSAYFVRLPIPAQARAEAERAIEHFERCRVPGGAQIAHERFRYDLGKNVPEGIAQIGLTPPRGFAGRNRQRLRGWGCATAIVVPMLGVPVGSMVGEALGPQWGVSTMAAGVVVGLVVGIATLIVARKRAPD